MINKILYQFIYIFFLLIFNLSIAKSEQFNFNVTEIEILNNGNLYKGLNRGVIETDNGIEINADTFVYDKLTNIVNAEGEVKIEDKINNYIIYSDKAIYQRNEEIVFTDGNSRAIDDKNREIIANKITYSKIPNTINAEGEVKIEDKSEDYQVYSEKLTYFKNDEKIITEGFTEAKIQSEYNIKSENVLFKLEPKELSSQVKSTVKDNNNQIYYLDEFIYHVDENLLKGKGILTITNYNLPKSDKFYFSDGIFNLKDKKFFGKDTEVNIHKNVFARDKNDPRIYGVSSKGDENITILKKSIFTSCQKRDGCPPWSIKSEEILHDKQKKQLSYKNAFINVYDIPVFYFPKFFHPDPSVIKQSGLLKPEINGSDVLGSSITQPYFWMISENKDFTITPTWSDNDFITIQNEFRQANKNSNFLADFGFVNNYKSSTTKEKNTLSHFFLNYDLDLKLNNFNSSKLFFSTEQVTNDTYLKVFDTFITKSEARPENLDVLNNQIKLFLTHEKYNFDAGILAYEDLGKDKDSDRYEFTLPYYNFDAVLDENYFNGSINLNSSGSNNLDNTNNLKSNIINNINYNSNNYITKSGFNNDLNISFKNLNSLGKNSSDYKSSPQVELLTMFEANTSLPLLKKDENYNKFLTPKISFRFNPSDMKNYRESSNRVDTGNVFSLNRLGLGDTFESGRSLTLGLDYKKESNDLDDINKYFEIKLATVIRDKEEEFVPTASTIGRKNSNIFGSVENNLYENIKFNYEFALDNNLSTFEYNQLGATFKLNNFETTFNFIEENGEMGDSNIFENSISYNFDSNNNFTFKTRRNRKINLTEYYDLVYEYKNDCLTAGIKYKKSYYEDRDLKPTENLLFTITLFPLTTYEHDAGDLLKNEDSFLKNLELDSRMFK